jgi:hypothetical protein
MDEKKVNQGFDRLAPEELDEVTGGIPYEKPGLIMFAAGKANCAFGGTCRAGKVGDDYCNTGYSCGTGEPVFEE